ncbi:hypothetical protein PM082_021345 [Marasmius tenuissimus]|nr:hypothetical protein PM082_021345 [Marasmius tenuissimus]
MMTYLFEWFNKRMGLANGVLYSGSGAGGVVFPFVIDALLQRYGRKITLLSVAVALFVFVLPCFWYIKPRQPVAHVVGPRSFNLKSIRRRAFWVLCVANLVQAFGNYIPSLYLPAFAADMKMSTTRGSLAVALLNGFSAPGCIFLGHLSDRFDLRISILLSSLGSAIAVLCIWGTTRESTVAPILVFAAVYGFLAQSWSALWTRFVSVSVSMPGVGGSSSRDTGDPHLASGLLAIYVAGNCLPQVLVRWSLLG